MNRSRHLSVLALLCFTGFAFGDAPPGASETLRQAYEALGKMGLTIEKAENKVISGRYGVAVPRAAVIEENGKTYVVVLDEKDVSRSQRLEIATGKSSGSFIQTGSQISPGDYIVVRKEALVATVEKPVQVVERKKVPQRPAPAAAAPPIAKRIESIYPATNRNDERFYISTAPAQPEPEPCQFCKEVHEEVEEQEFVPEPVVLQPFPRGDIRNTFENFGLGGYRTPWQY
ncbi:MAG: hypothetical protein P1V20_24830 [Verrucomicrobiales bacterium]|nr:hypothetical protein [Verrucomicrobiales bacterium]